MEVENKFWSTQANLNKLSEDLLGDKVVKKNPLVAKYKDALKDESEMSEIGKMLKNNPGLPLCPVSFIQLSSEMKQELRNLIEEREYASDNKVLALFTSPEITTYRDRSHYLTPDEIRNLYTIAQKQTVKAWKSLKDSSKVAPFTLKKIIEDYEKAVQEYEAVIKNQEVLSKN